MSELFRDTVVGQLLRLVTQRRILQYPEERDPSIWQKYLNVEKSANMARHGGTTTPPQAEEKDLESGSSSAPTTPTGEEEERLPKDDLNFQAPHGDEKMEEHNLRPMSDHESLSQHQTSAPGEDINVLVNTLSGTRIDPEKGRDADIVDWYGPDDPENPQNWSTFKKVWVTFEICLLTFSVYIGSSIYTPGIPEISEEFGVSPVAATLGLTLFVLGYGVGPMLWSPMSEIPQTGRGPIYIGTLALFVVLQLPVALATNFGMLLAFRFITGFVGSPALATGGATIQDIYNPKKRTYGLALWGVGAVCGPVMGT